jgi:hypothetical protein
LKHSGWIGLVTLLGCGGPPDQERVAGDRVVSTPPADSLVLTTSSGTQVWFTLARPAADADGSSCVERSLEIRQGGMRVKVPLLYTGSPPVLLNDSTMRAILWTHCRPGNAYLVNLRSGHPLRETGGNHS